MSVTVKAPPSAPRRTERSIERFMPRADVTERHDTLIHAPADLVMEAARELDLESLTAVRAIFWLREKFMRSNRMPSDRRRGLAARTRALGWGVLVHRPDREYVSGAVTQPWKGNVVFRSVPAAEFAGFSEPDLVKIVWTLEAEPLGPGLTRFRSETRAVATSDRARVKFLRYWRFARFGIVAIRWLAGPAIRRDAERRYRRRLAAV